MSRGLEILIQIVVSLGVPFALALTLSYFAGKKETKRLRREFTLMCYAVAAEICRKTGCNYDALCEEIDDRVDYCEKIKASKAHCAEGYPAYEISHTDNNYLEFTHLIALKYVKENDVGEYVKEAVLASCRERLAKPERHHYTKISVRPFKSRESCAVFFPILLFGFFILFGIFEVIIFK